MRNVMTWKSTSSNGWEYFIVWKDLGSSPMLLFYIYINHVVECYNHWIILVSMKSGLVEWFGIGLVCAWVWVQTLEDPNETLFLPFLVLIWSWRVKGNPSRHSSQG